MPANHNPDSPVFQQWCLRMFASMADGGIWAVPRSGLIFTRRGDRFVLTTEMPFLPEMEGTITREQLWEQQREDYETIRDHFAAAGIVVEKEVTV